MSFLLRYPGIPQSAPLFKKKHALFLQWWFFENLPSPVNEYEASAPKNIETHISHQKEQGVKYMYKYVNKTKHKNITNKS